MTDAEVIKALECCANNGDCKECAINPHKGNYGYCTSIAIKSALDLINRQKAEIERLSDHFREVTKKIKTEAIKEFAERLENKLANNTDISAVGYQSVIGDIINIIKEMAGDTK